MVPVTVSDVMMSASRVFTLIDEGKVRPVQVVHVLRPSRVGCYKEMPVYIYIAQGQDLHYKVAPYSYVYIVPATYYMVI